MANFDDTYDETRNLVEVEFQNGKEIKPNELNEAQRIERVRRRRTIQALKNGLNSFNGDGFKVVENSPNTNQIKLSAGTGFVGGEIISLENDLVVTGLTTPGAPRVDEVYLEVREVERDSTTFPDTGNIAIGETTTRLQLVVSAQVAEGGVTPASTGELHVGGIVRFHIATLNRDANNTVTTAEITDTRPLIGISVPEGGTGQSSFDNGKLIVGNGGVNPLTQIAQVSDGRILRDEGAGNDPSWDTVNNVLTDTLDNSGIVAIQALDGDPDTVHGYNIERSVSGGDLIISLKNNLGTDPSASNPVYYSYNTSLGAYVKAAVTSALSITIVAAQSFGYDTVADAELFVYLIYDSVDLTSRLAVARRSHYDNGRFHQVFPLNVNTLETEITSTVVSGISATPRLLCRIPVSRSGAAWTGFFESTTLMRDMDISNPSTATALYVAHKRVLTASGGILGAVAISSSSGIFQTSSSSYVNVTNLSVTLTRSGNRPVRVELQTSDVSDNQTGVFGGTGIGYIKFLRDAVVLGTVSVQPAGDANGPLNGVPLATIDGGNLPSATHTYTVQARVATGTLQIIRLRLIVHEM